MQKYFPHFFCFFLIICSLATPAFAGENDENSFQSLLHGNASSPELTVIYTATTRGELYPCPTCGDTALGGLARRDTFVNSVRHNRDKESVIVINGPDEILSDNDILPFLSAGKSGPDGNFKQSKAKLLLAAHKLLKPTVGYLSTVEADWLKKAAGGVPHGYLTVNKLPVTTIVNTPQGKLGLVLFPHGTERFGIPSDQQTTEALAAGEKLRGKVNLVIGVSPWGSRAEERFIPKAENIYDILLGGGPGLGFPFSSQYSSSKILWVRSENQGRAVNVLSIFELPPMGVKADWLEDVTFSARQNFLKASVPSSPAMLKLIGTKLQ